MAKVKKTLYGTAGLVGVLLLLGMFLTELKARSTQYFGRSCVFDGGEVEVGHGEPLRKAVACGGTRWRQAGFRLRIVHQREN